MQKLKTLLRRAVAPLCFVLCALLLIGLADAVLSPKSDTMSAFYAEPGNTIDVLFVGGSHGAAAFDPIQLWQEQGFAAYNLFSWGQPAWTTYHYIVEALKSQRPRVVVVEAFGLMYGRSYMTDANFNETSDDYSLLMRPSLNRVQLALAMSKWQTDHRSPLQYLSLARYHSRWQVFSPAFLTYFFEDHSTTGKGFGPGYTVEPFPPNVRPEALPQADLYPGCEEYLHKMIALAKAEGFALVVATAPYVVEQPGEWAVYDQIAAICAENGVPYLDYNQAEGAEAGFDFATDMAEHAHVNLYGAQKISAHIGAWLAAAYPLPDRRADAAYAAWHEAAEVEGLDRERMLLRMSQSGAEYLARLASPNFTAFVLTRGALPEGPPALAEALEGLGLPADVLGGGQPLLAVLDGGQVALLQRGNSLAAEWETERFRVELRGNGESASILRGGTEEARDHDGIMILVVDRQTGAFVQSVTLDANDGYAIKTE